MLFIKSEILFRRMDPLSGISEAPERSFHQMHLSVGIQTAHGKKAVLDLGAAHEVTAPGSHQPMRALTSVRRGHRHHSLAPLHAVALNQDHQTDPSLQHLLASVPHRSYLPASSAMLAAVAVAETVAAEVAAVAKTVVAAEVAAVAKTVVAAEVAVVVAKTVVAVAEVAVAKTAVVEVVVAVARHVVAVEVAVAKTVVAEAVAAKTVVEAAVAEAQAQTDQLAQCSFSSAARSRCASSAPADSRDASSCASAAAAAPAQAPCEVESHQDPPTSSSRTSFE